MKMKVSLRHVTQYQYSQEVQLGPQLIKLRPAPHCRTPISSYQLTIKPSAYFINWQQDPFSNHVARLVFTEKTNFFEINVELTAELKTINPFDFFVEPSAEHHPFKYEANLIAGLSPYLETEPCGPLFQEFINSIPQEKRRTIEYVVYLNQLVFNKVRYMVRLEPGVQSTEETLKLNSGSCRDSSWLLVQLCRHMGIAARFVSGYLIEATADWHNLNSPTESQENVAELHAWCEVFIPGAGWVGIDPTSGLLATEGHIPLAAAPDPSNAMPIYGELDMCEVKMSHKITTLMHKS
jgi:transglutaminase-like putative cysteine protease